jgi:hypothetical protein
MHMGRTSVGIPSLPPRGPCSNQRSTLLTFISFNTWPVSNAAMKQYGVTMHTGASRARKPTDSSRGPYSNQGAALWFWLCTFFSPPIIFSSTLSLVQSAAMKAEWCNDAHGQWDKSGLDQMSLFESRCCCFRRFSRTFILSPLFPSPLSRVQNAAMTAEWCNDAHGCFLYQKKLDSSWSPWSNRSTALGTAGVSWLIPPFSLTLIRA